MAKRKRLNRSADMDDALFEALKIPVPQKDTGPDPDDILAGLFDDHDELNADEEFESLDAAQGQPRALTIDLDEVDRKNATQIVNLVRAQTGEQIEMAEAIRIALNACQCDPGEIDKAYRAIYARKLENE